MRPSLAIITAIASVAFGGVVLVHQEVGEIVVGGHVKKPGSYDRIEHESLAALLNRIGGIPASQAELKQYRRGQSGFRVRINLYRDGKKQALKIDPSSNELWDLKIMKNDVVEVVRAEPFESVEYPDTIKLKKQADTAQPVTLSESKSEASAKSQPEAKVRSR